MSLICDIIVIEQRKGAVNMEKLPYDKRIAAAIRKNLDENGINYSFDADRAQFLFGAKLNCALDKAYYTKNEGAAKCRAPRLRSRRDARPYR